MNDLEEKSSWVADQLVDAIQKVHGRPRPFIVIFPHDDGQIESITNITSIDAVSMILQDYVNSLEHLDEMTTIEERIPN